MDSLTTQLKRDAELIDVQVSDELDHRIAASLEGITPERPREPAPQQRPAIFWWASALTGVAAAFLVIAVFSSRSQLEAEKTPMIANSVPEAASLGINAPTIDWKAESAMLTQPLRRELEDLQSDLKKAEEKVKRDIGL